MVSGSGRVGGHAGGGGGGGGGDSSSESSSSDQLLSQPGCSCAMSHLLNRTTQAPTREAATPELPHQ